MLEKSNIDNNIRKNINDIQEDIIDIDKYIQITSENIIDAKVELVDFITDKTKHIEETDLIAENIEYTYNIEGS